MAECSVLLMNSAPGCNAKQRKGGIKKKVWAGFFDAATFTEDGSGNVDSITLATASPANVLYTFEGKKRKNSGTYEGQVGENTNTINQNLTIKFFYYTEEEREAIKRAFLAEDLFFVVETENEQLELWGYDSALNASALTGGTGAELNDDTSITITFSGQQDGLSKVFTTNGGTDITADIAYLNALV